MYLLLVQCAAETCSAALDAVFSRLAATSSVSEMHWSLVSDDAVCALVYLNKFNFSLTLAPSVSDFVRESVARDNRSVSLIVVYLREC
jgi:hypothetical protein